MHATLAREAPQGPNPMPLSDANLIAGITATVAMIPTMNPFNMTATPAACPMAMACANTLEGERCASSAPIVAMADFR